MKLIETILEFREELKNELACITTKKSDTSSIILLSSGNEISITSDYNPKEFGFSPEDFVSVPCNCGCILGFKIGICVGVGKGCSKSPEQDELWFFLQGNKGITHFCGARANDFAKNGVVLFNPTEERIGPISSINFG
ncbi:MAG: hypothetical protein WCW54_03430 [Candidatus Paceibacterota bacterium]